MFEKPAELKKLFEEKIAAVAATADVEQLRIEFLGKKGSVAALMQELRNVPNDQKKEAGQIINETKQFIEGAIATKIVELKALEEQGKSSQNVIDGGRMKLKSREQNVEMLCNLPRNFCCYRCNIAHRNSVVFIRNCQWFDGNTKSDRAGVPQPGAEAPDRGIQGWQGDLYLRRPKRQMKVRFSKQHGLS